MKKIALTAAVLLSLTACISKEKKEFLTLNETAMKTETVNEVAKAQNDIKNLMNTLFSETDNRNWETVKATMTDSVYVDYSALGGEPGFRTPEEIVGGWQQVLPGFERTVHQPHNYAIWVAGKRATATLDALAVHYLDGQQWTVFVGYDTEFILESGQWRLARIDLSLYDQTGNTDLPAQAIELVKNGNTAQLTEVAPSSKEVVEGLFEALEAQKLEDVLASFTQDAIQEMPFAPDNFPKALSGIEALSKQYSGVMNYTQSYEREYFATGDPNIVIAKYRGTVTTGEGKPYNNSYVGIFRVTHGKIAKFFEFFNPNILLNSWPGLQPETFSVHQAGASRDSGVRMEEVTFNSNGANLKGHLFLPPKFKATEKYPAAIVTGSWTSVKEQMPDEYASLLAKEGFVALTFDFTGFGESEGEPRFVEDYHLKINDIRAAADFLSTHSNVDADQLNGLGVCASSGYMAHATAQDDRIKTLVLVAPWLHNAEIAKTIYDMRPGGTDGLLTAAEEAKQKYAETGEMDYVLAASELDPLSAMYVPENAFDYYLNPAKAAGSHYDNLFAVSSWEPWLTFDAISAAEHIEQPVFIVHSESGAIPQGAKEFYELLRSEKEIKWLNDYNQQELYYKPEAVNKAIGEVVNYLKQ